MWLYQFLISNSQNRNLPGQKNFIAPLIPILQIDVNFSIILDGQERLWIIEIRYNDIQIIPMLAINYGQ